MSKCDNDDFKRALVRTEIHKMLESGFLQYALTDCKGIRLGQGAEIMLCCPGCKEASPPTPGPDADTTNRSMAWDTPTQEVSVTDSSGNKVETIISFNKSEGPTSKPVTGEFKNFYGRDKDIILSGPTSWLDIILHDGKTYKIPAYTDVEIPTGCIPLVQRRAGDGEPLPYVSFSVSAVVKHGETFQDFFNRDTDLSGIQWQTVKTEDNVNEWREAGSKIVQALGIDQSEADWYAVHLTGRGWINLADMVDFHLNEVIRERVYGYSAYGGGLQPIHDRVVLGLDMQGVPLTTVTPDCGFHNLPVPSNRFVLYISDDTGMTKEVIKDDIYFNPTGPASFMESLAHQLNHFKQNNMTPSEVITHIKTPFGTLDMNEAFPTGEIITGAPNGAPTSLNTQMTVYFYENALFDGNNVQINKNNKTGWILDNMTTRLSGPSPIDVHHIITRVDPVHVSGSYDSQKAMLLVG